MTSNNDRAPEVRVYLIKKSILRRRLSRLISSIKRINIKQSYKMIIGGLTLVVIVVGVSLIVIQKSTVKQNKGRDLTKILTVNQTKEVVRGYSLDYTSTSEDLQKTSFNNWNKETVDKAYFTLLYADKIGAYTQVYNTLFILDTVSKNRVNIDDNSYGVNAQTRSEIRARADANVQKVNNSRMGQ